MTRMTSWKVKIIPALLEVATAAFTNTESRTTTVIKKTDTLGRIIMSPPLVTTKMKIQETSHTTCMVQEVAEATEAVVVDKSTDTTATIKTDTTKTTITLALLEDTTSTKVVCSEEEKTDT